MIATRPFLASAFAPMIAHVGRHKLLWYIAVVVTLGVFLQLFVDLRAMSWR